MQHGSDPGLCLAFLELSICRLPLAINQLVNLALPTHPTAINTLKLQRLTCHHSMLTSHVETYC